MKRFTVAALMGAVAVALGVYEWDFSRRARAGRAIVVTSSVLYRCGLTVAEVLHVVDGERVSARLRVWYRNLVPGERVRVLYRAEEPTEVVLDAFWPRHYASTLALLASLASAAVEIRRAAAERRRRHSVLLRDDFVPPLSDPGEIPPLAIDTAPLLWDHELDG